LKAARVSVLGVITDAMATAKNMAVELRIRFDTRIKSYISIEGHDDILWLTNAFSRHVYSCYFRHNNALLNWCSRCFCCFCKKLSASNIAFAAEMLGSGGAAKPRTAAKSAPARCRSRQTGKNQSRKAGAPVGRTHSRSRPSHIAKIAYNSNFVKHQKARGLTARAEKLLG
jgi:hypothetical protein